MGECYGVLDACADGAASDVLDRQPLRLLAAAANGYLAKAGGLSCRRQTEPPEDDLPTDPTLRAEELAKGGVLRETARKVAWWRIRQTIVIYPAALAVAMLALYGIWELIQLATGSLPAWLLWIATGDQAFVASCLADTPPLLAPTVTTKADRSASRTCWTEQQTKIPAGVWGEPILQPSKIFDAPGEFILPQLPQLSSQVASALSAWRCLGRAVSQWRAGSSIRWWAMEAVMKAAMMAGGPRYQTRWS